MTRFPDLHTRPKHDITQTNLEMMIRDLRITLDAHEDIGTLQRVRAIATIREAREDVSRCSRPFSELVKHQRPELQIQDDRWPNHMALTTWLNELSVDLKQLSIADSTYVRRRLTVIDDARLDVGLKLVRELDGCREELRFER